jgi:hypothetical protein
MFYVQVKRGWSFSQNNVQTNKNYPLFRPSVPDLNRALIPNVKTGFKLTASTSIKCTVISTSFIKKNNSKFT